VVSSSQLQHAPVVVLPQPLLVNDATQVATSSEGSGGAGGGADGGVGEGEGEPNQPNSRRRSADSAESPSGRDIRRCSDSVRMALTPPMQQTTTSSATVAARPPKELMAAEPEAED